MKIQLISLLVISVVSAFAQKPLSYSFSLPIEVQKKKGLEQVTQNWLLEQNAKVSKVEKDTIWAYGELNFINTVVYKESKTYNRVYREQSNGKFIYKIKLYPVNHQVYAEISHFKHQPSMKFDNLNFGIITDADTAPKQIVSMTNETYSVEVWNLMKENIKNYTENLSKDSKSTVLRE